MTCKEIESRLPAYSEDMVSPQEHASITGHLAGCTRCRTALANLKQAESLLQNLGEVEPPPFFEQRIMAQVREEAGRKQGFLQRLFYPLPIKIPIQVMATLFVAVLAFQIYQQGDQERTQMTPPIPLAERGPGQATAKSPRTDAASPDVSSVAQTKAGTHRAKDDERFAVPPPAQGGKEERRAEQQAPLAPERPVPMRVTDSVPAVREMEALNKAKDRVEKQDAGRVAVAGESKKTMSAPAPSGMGMMAAADIKGPAIDLTIQVSDVDRAKQEIEARLGHVKARIIESKAYRGSALLRAEIAAQDIDLFVDLLGAVGKVKRDTILVRLPDGKVTITIYIVVSN